MKTDAQVPTKKVTMILPVSIIDNALQATGVGLTETTRIALEELARREAYERLQAVRGKVDLGITWEELKELRD